MKPRRYLVILADKKNAKIFTLYDGAITQLVGFTSEDIPQKVKHGDDTWDAQDKIFRHIEDHVHRHLNKVNKEAKKISQQTPVFGLMIGSHKWFIPKIEKHLTYPLSQKVIGTFVASLKSPFNETLKKVKVLTDNMEKKTHAHYT